MVVTAATAVRVLRIGGLIVAAIAAVAIFLSDSSDGQGSWQLRALVFIGVLVVILHVATTTWTSASTETTTEVVEYFPIPEHLLHATPGHLAEPTAAETRIQAPEQNDASPAALPTHPGMPGLVVSSASFPDAGHSHGPVIAVNDGQLPPLHEVLRPVPAPPSPSEVDSVLLDIRPDRGDEQLVYPIVAPQPLAPVTPPTAQAPPSAPIVAPPAPPAPPASPPVWAPPQDWAPPGEPGSAQRPSSS